MADAETSTAELPTRSSVDKLNVRPPDALPPGQRSEDGLPGQDLSSVVSGHLPAGIPQPGGAPYGAGSYYPFGQIQTIAHVYDPTSGTLQPVFVLPQGGGVLLSPSSHAGAPMPHGAPPTPQGTYNNMYSPGGQRFSPPGGFNRGYEGWSPQSQSNPYGGGGMPSPYAMMPDVPQYYQGTSGYPAAPAYVQAAPAPPVAESKRAQKRRQKMAAHAAAQAGPVLASHLQEIGPASHGSRVSSGAGAHPMPPVAVSVEMPPSLPAGQRSTKPSPSSMNVAAAEFSPAPAGAQLPPGFSPPLPLSPPPPFSPQAAPTPTYAGMDAAFSPAHSVSAQTPMAGGISLTLADVPFQLPPDMPPLPLTMLLPAAIEKIAKFRSKLCIFHLNSGGASCPYGSRCTYAHGEEQLRMSAEAAEKLRQEMVHRQRLHATGGHHGMSPHPTGARPTPGRKRMCHHWLQSGGESCLKGSSCPFSHDAASVSPMVAQQWSQPPPAREETASHEASTAPSASSSVPSSPSQGAITITYETAMPVDAVQGPPPASARREAKKKPAIALSIASASTSTSISAPTPRNVSSSASTLPLGLASSPQPSQQQSTSREAEIVASLISPSMYPRFGLPPTATSMGIRRVAQFQQQHLDEALDATPRSSAGYALAKVDSNGSDGALESSQDTVGPLLSGGVDYSFMTTADYAARTLRRANTERGRGLLATPPLYPPSTYSLVRSSGDSTSRSEPAAPFSGPPPSVRGPPPGLPAPGPRFGFEAASPRLGTPGSAASVGSSEGSRKSSAGMLFNFAGSSPPDAPPDIFAGASIHSSMTSRDVTHPSLSGGTSSSSSSTQPHNASPRLDAKRPMVRSLQVLRSGQSISEALGIADKGVPEDTPYDLYASAIGLSEGSGGNVATRHVRRLSPAGRPLSLPNPNRTFM